MGRNSLQPGEVWGSGATETTLGIAEFQPQAAGHCAAGASCLLENEEGGGGGRRRRPEEGGGGGRRRK